MRLLVVVVCGSVVLAAYGCSGETASPSARDGDAGVTVEPAPDPCDGATFLVYCQKGITDEQPRQSAYGVNAMCSATPFLRLPDGGVKFRNGGASRGLEDCDVRTFQERPGIGQPITGVACCFE